MSHASTTIPTTVPSYVQASAAAQRAHAAAQAAAGYTYPPNSAKSVNPVAAVSAPTSPAIMPTVMSAPIVVNSNNISSNIIHNSNTTNNLNTNKPQVGNKSRQDDDQLLWQLDLQGIERWMRSNNALFPKQPRLRIDPTTGESISQPRNPARPTPSTPEQIQAETNFRLEQQNLQQQERNKFNEKNSYSKSITCQST